MSPEPAPMGFAKIDRRVSCRYPVSMQLTYRSVNG